MKLSNIKEFESRPEILVLIGLPGVGKSTFINKNYNNHVIISSDNIIEKYAKEEGKTYSDVFHNYIGRATSEMKEDFQRAIENNENIIWDQTNLTKKKRRGILNQIPSHYKKIAVVFDVPDKIPLFIAGYQC